MNKRNIITFLISVVAIAVIAFAFFYPDASQGNELRQHDMLQGIAINQEVKAHLESTGETDRKSVV